MELKNFLTPTMVSCHPKQVTNKKQVLELISKMISEADPEGEIKASHIFATLQKRERLGSTAMGHGIAIPHGRIQNLIHPSCVLITLEDKIDFTNNDEEMLVDIIFGLAVPEKATQEHLDLLGIIADKCSNKSYRDHLREATSNYQLHQVATTELVKS
jgi:nitrogen PTS system EIIA component